MKKTAILIGALMVGACTDASTAIRTAEAHGFTDVETRGYAFFSCGEDDTFSTAFEATAPNGERVSGAVCSTLLTKSATLRLD